MSNLTISQALRRIKKLKGSISELQARAKVNVSYDKSKIPVFRYTDDMNSLSACKAELLELEGRVAVANATHVVKYQNKDLTLSTAIRILQEFKDWITFYKNLVLRNQTERDKEESYSEEHNKFITQYKEIVYCSDLSEQERDKKVKEVQDEFETLNNIVESANHQVVL